MFILGLYAVTMTALAGMFFVYSRELHRELTDRDRRLDYNPADRVE